MTELLIADAGAADVGGLLKLYLHLNPEDGPVALDEAIKTLEKLRRYDGSTILVGKVDGVIVASCSLIVIPNLTRSGKSYALVENVVTHNAWRQRGFGAALLKLAADRARKHGCYKLMLMTGSKDPGTLTFYEKIGFDQSKTGFQMRLTPA